MSYLVKDLIKARRQAARKQARLRWTLLALALAGILIPLAIQYLMVGHISTTFDTTSSTYAEPGPNYLPHGFLILTFPSLLGLISITRLHPYPHMNIRLKAVIAFLLCILAFTAFSKL